MPFPCFDVERGGQLGIDMGGTLAKVMFYEPRSNGSKDANALQKYILDNQYYGQTGYRDDRLTIHTEHGNFYFILFHTARVPYAISLIREQRLHVQIRLLPITGGGAYKFAEMLRKQLPQCDLHRMDEMSCLIEGVNFMLRHVKDESYYFSAVEDDNDYSTVTKEYERGGEDIFPYLIVNVGTGVSFLKVVNEKEYERVSGSGMGGGTYYGLCKLLTNINNTFSDSLELAKKGDESKLNVTVGDIYGGSFSKWGLDPNQTASFFAKTTTTTNAEYTQEDICRSLLLMVTNNLGQITYLIAKLHKLKNIYFAGNFLRTNKISMKYLSRAIKFWSNNLFNAYFLSHEGFCGAMGAFLLSHKEMDSEDDKN